MEGPPEDWSQPNSPWWKMARYVIHLRCLRCGTWRHTAITRTGERLTSRYSYPEDYLMPRGEARPDPDRLRLWLAVPSRWK